MEKIRLFEPSCISSFVGTQRKPWIVPAKLFPCKSKYPIQIVFPFSRLPVICNAPRRKLCYFGARSDLLFKILFTQFFRSERVRNISWNAGFRIVGDFVHACVFFVTGFLQTGQGENVDSPQTVPVSAYWDAFVA